MAVRALDEQPSAERLHAIGHAAQSGAVVCASAADAVVFDLDDEAVVVAMCAYGRVRRLRVLDGVRKRFADDEVRSGFDLRGQRFDHLWATHFVGAAAVEVADGHMDVTVWRDGAPERVIRKH